MGSEMTARTGYLEWEWKEGWKATKTFLSFLLLLKNIDTYTVYLICWDRKGAEEGKMGVD